MRWLPIRRGRRRYVYESVAEVLPLIHWKRLELIGPPTMSKSVMPETSGGATSPSDVPDTSTVSATWPPSTMLSRSTRARTAISCATAATPPHIHAPRRAIRRGRTRVARADGRGSAPRQDLAPTHRSPVPRRLPRIVPSPDPDGAGPPPPPPAVSVCP